MVSASFPSTIVSPNQEVFFCVVVILATLIQEFESPARTNLLLQQLNLVLYPSSFTVCIHLQCTKMILPILLIRSYCACQRSSNIERSAQFSYQQSGRRYSHSYWKGIRRWVYLSDSIQPTGEYRKRRWCCNQQLDHSVCRYLPSNGQPSAGSDALTLTTSAVDTFNFQVPAGIAPGVYDVVYTYVDDNTVTVIGVTLP
jgi:hypothetical protein